MIVNDRKTKEILFGSILKDLLSLFATLKGTHVERVFKSGVHVANDSKWMQHVDAISLKVLSRLYFSPAAKLQKCSLCDKSMILRQLTVNIV